MSSVALFLSLGGVGYASVFLPNGSVGNAQLRNDAVSYAKIAPGSVGIVRANTGQLQVRVSGACGTGTAIGSINSIGKVTCNTALPAEFGTTNNTESLPTTATTPVTVATLSLPAGGTYLAFANPAVTVTGTGTNARVTVSCTLTVGSNTEVRTATVDTGTATTAYTTSIPMQAAGGAGTAGVACSSSVPSDITARPAVSVIGTVNALATSSNG
jgi:hypothetical protein